MVSHGTRLLVRERAQARCEYCRAPEIITGTAYHIEHIVPRSQGGSDAISNLALSCVACNGHKADRVSALDPETDRPTPLFNPRSDRWARHFRFSAETLEVHGLTAKGRATVSQLKMNDPRQVEARELWVALALYP